MTILISVICSIISAFIVHQLAMNRIQKNEIIKFRLTAYSDFIGSSSRLIVARRIGQTENNLNDLALLNDAKNRIIISAQSAIVSELIEFLNHGGTLEREQELQSYKRLITLMRNELGFKKSDLFKLDISNALFNLEPSTFSYRARKKTNKPMKQD